MAIKLFGRVLYNGENYFPDDVIENIDADAAERLVNSEVAFYVGDQPIGEVPTEPIETDEETIEEILDINFKLEEFKDEADAINLEYPKNIKKKQMIALIIEAGKEQHFLDMLED